MKKHYRSRSRSRSHSRERNYPTRDFQGNRGYNRGFRGYRRPFYYNNRGRGRGYYPRGYHRGGGNYGYRSNNWHGGHRDQQQSYESHHSHSPKRGRSRSRSPRKRSGSRSRSRFSERSSSRSRRSSSSSRSSSPRRRNAGKAHSKDSKSKGSPAEGKVPVKEEETKQPSVAAAVPEEPPSKWESMSDYDTSPKQSNQGPKTSTAQPDVKVSLSGASGNGASLWRSIESNSPPKPTSSSTGFGFFSKEDMKTTDKSAQISSAFKKFLAEKKKPTDWDNGQEEEADVEEAEKEKSSRKQRGLFEAEPVYGETKTDKGLPFLDEEEEAYLKGLKERKTEEETKYKSKATLPARDLFEERFGKWDDDYAPNKDSAQREDEVDEDEHVMEELYRSRKQAARKEEKASKKKEKKKNRVSPSSPSPPRTSERGRPLFPAAKEASPPARTTKKKEPEFSFSLKAFNEEAESSSGALAKERRLSQDLVHPAKKEHEEFRSIFQHIQAAQLRRSPSELFAQHIVNIVHHIKAQHFRSSGMTLNERFGMYQRKAAQMEMRQRKSPEIHRRIDVSPSAFKKHTRLFEDMEESEYKDYGKKYEGDSMDLRLDIERRKKYPKREGGKGSAGSRTPSRELSPDKPSKHKKSKKSKKKRERSPSSSSSSSPSPSPHAYRPREYHGEELEHVEKGGFDKSRLGPREFPGPRDYEGGHMERGYERGRGGYDRGGYDRGGYDRGRGGYDRGFPRMRGRGWNRGNYPGNNNNGNPANMGGPVRPQDEEWDPEYTPKSRKYFQHDDRDGEMKWAEGRGRGRGLYPRSRGTFLVRRGSSGGSPKWTHDMFQGATEEGELPDDVGDHGHKDEDKTAESETSKP
ncbi:thyroid hormone receptor-associated protein 3b isoform X2 [Hoplias malabaricus]|uniref:thyroid hormone receptor-associated protein 3b isoform X2 n=1 Tax=Hoplias malabaricus TaxID=27720 RepID=UPI003462704D